MRKNILPRPIQLQKKCIAIFIFIFFIICHAHNILPLDFNVQAAQQDSSIAEFTLKDLNGRLIKSASLKGNIIILDFWAIWCEPCIAEIPDFNKLQQKYGAMKLKVFGVAAQSGWAKDIKPHAVKYSIQYPVLVGDDDIVSRFQVIGFPTTFVIDKHGKIYRKYFGTSPTKQADLEKDIQALMASSPQ